MATQTVLVTGASRGIGHATVKRFSEAGWRIITCSRSPLHPSCPWDAGEENHLQIDLASHEEIARGVDELMERLDGAPLHALVNNAGIQGNEYTVEEIDEEIWEAMTFIKMKATFFAARAVIPGMKKRNYGKLINVSSIFAMEGSFSMSHYTGAASGVLGYAKGWARELAPWNICANAVAPGTVATDLTINSMGWDVIHDFEKTVPMGRLAEKREIAYAVAWLASRESDFVTGQLISPTGGQTIVGI